MLHKTSPLTVAGAVTELAPIGSSTPCSLFGLSSHDFEAPRINLLAGQGVFRQPDYDGWQAGMRHLPMSLTQETVS